ncbi:ParB N-terminal domain-containing protein [Sulfidibacter corallicola]|uniref:ParB N-terminal domain-containing protein n=1 Tax=Sulfidibacter corallicola TaxID=2818388 RepID=A0A8A4TMC6_SULCO|nr:ParB N-terminal domain-containing protein [Sulfidibacter corallicola]
MTATKPLHRALEVHQLQRPFGHHRIFDGAAIDALARDLDRRGQLVPVSVARGADGQLVLLDGYRRLAALDKLRRDTVQCEIWPGDPTQGLLTLLARMGGRCWDALEEGLTLRYLHEERGMTAEAIAQQSGRSQSWVRSRLRLVSEVPEEGRTAVMQGRLSPWVAVRVMAPLARAHPAHARQVIEATAKHGLSSREWRDWFDAYQGANQVVRQRLVDQPRLWIEAKREHALARKSRELAEGPEGKWRTTCRRLTSGLRSLRQQLPILCQGLDDAGWAAVMRDVAKVTREWEALQKQLERRQHDVVKVVTTHSGTDQETAPTGHAITRNQPADGCLAQCDSAPDPAPEGRGATSGHESTPPPQRADPRNLLALSRQRDTCPRNPRTGTRDSGRLQHPDAVSPRGSPA